MLSLYYFEYDGFSVQNYISQIFAFIASFFICIWNFPHNIIKPSELILVFFPTWREKNTWKSIRIRNLSSIPSGTLPHTVLIIREQQSKKTGNSSLENITSATFFMWSLLFWGSGMILLAHRHSKCMLRTGHFLSRQISYLLFKETYYWIL